MKVKSIDAFAAKLELKKCPKIVRDYVRSLEQAYEICRETNKIAFQEIKELSK